MMPPRRQSLQRQGVPIPDRLEQPNVVRPQGKGQSAPTRPRAQRRTNRGANARRTQNNVAIGEYRKYGPTQLADKSSSGVGLLEAEFFGIIFLLVLQLFIGGSSTYGDKIMSFMKRGTLTALLFFFLALIAGIGSNAAKVAKGIGGLVFVAILVSSPGQDIITSLDNFIKSDWVGTSEHGPEQQASADTGTAAGSSGVIQKAESAASNAANTITEINLPGIGPVVGLETALNALKGFLHL